MKNFTDYVGITGPQGRYNDIEDWIYDCSLESMIPYTTIDDALDKGYKIFDSKDSEDNIGGYDDYDFPTEVEEKKQMSSQIGAPSQWILAT